MKLLLKIRLNSVSLHMATISKVLTPDGTRLCHQQVKGPNIVFWKVCTRGEYESLINAKQFFGCVRTRNHLMSIEAEL